jgi:hypothetical protein
MNDGLGVKELFGAGVENSVVMRCASEERASQQPRERARGVPSVARDVPRGRRPRICFILH